MSRFILNGLAADLISIQDRGLQYGDGLFETLVYDSGSLWLWDQHINRLTNSAQRLGLEAIAEQQWLSDIKQFDIEQPRAVIKLIQTRGIGGRGYGGINLEPNRIVGCYDWPDYPDTRGQGVKIRICQTPVSVNPALAGMKHLNRLDNVLARNEWSDPSIAEGLMLDDRGMIIEGTMSNVFAVKANTLLTPDLSRAGVAGVVRGEIIRLAEQMNLSVRCADIMPADLLAMDEVFLCNSIIGIWPVTQLDSREWLQGPVTIKLKEMLFGERYKHAKKI